MKSMLYDWEWKGYNIRDLKQKLSRDKGEYFMVKQYQATR